MGDIQEVELVEGGASEAIPSDAPQQRRRWWRAAGAVVVVGALVLAGQVVLDRRHREHEARFDDVPGVLLPVPREPHVAWMADDDAHAHLADAIEVGGVLVGGTLGDDGYSITGTDRATGAARWTVTGPLGDPGETTQWVTQDWTPRAQCVPMGAWVACGVDEVGPGYVAPDPEATRIVVLDPADGTVASDRVSSVRTWTADAEQVVTATSTRLGEEVTWTLTAYDVHGAQTWTRTLPAATVLDDADGVADYSTALRADDDRIAMMDEGHLWLVDHDGSLVEDRPVEARRFYGFDRGVVVSYPYANDDGTPSSEPAGFITHDGGWTPLAGTPLAIGVDDGSADGVVLSAPRTDEPSSTGPLEAHDATTGDLLWSYPAALVDSALVLDRTVFALVQTQAGDDVQHVVALDARAGRERWTSEPMRGAGLVGGLQLATDGRDVLALGPAVVAAFSIDDGKPAPPVDLAGAGPTNGVSAHDGLLQVDVADKSGSVVGVLG